MLTSDGNEYVLNFHLPGDMIGLEALRGGRYTSSATALERSGVCAWSHEDLDGTFDLASLHGIFEAFESEMADERELSMLVRRHDAEKRIEMFLLRWSQRSKERGFSATDLVLNMTRHDIGSYLALAPETVSRKLTHLQELGVLVLRGKHVILNDLQALHRQVAVDRFAA